MPSAQQSGYANSPSRILPIDEVSPSDWLIRALPPANIRKENVRALCHQAESLLSQLASVSEARCADLQQIMSILRIMWKMEEVHPDKVNFHLDILVAVVLEAIVVIQDEEIEENEREAIKLPATLLAVRMILRSTRSD